MYFARRSLLLNFAFGLLLLFFSKTGNAQNCTTAGQTPSSAFPVCGTSTFYQASVPQCGGRRLAYRGCSGDVLEDLNPYFYKFTCFQSGSLGFDITPNNIDDDYDWELYDITGRDPSEIYTNASIVIANNWSGEGGRTGASASGSRLFVCAGPGKPLYSSMPMLVAGRKYLLLVSHFTQSQSGYSLSFGGGTAVITDPKLPALQSVEANCASDELRVKINKVMNCKTIAADGSDFSISWFGATVIGAEAIFCAQGFDTDSIVLKLSNKLPPNNYTLYIKKGTDNNTVLDICNRPIPDTDRIDFTILPKAPTPMDSILQVGCAPSQAVLYFARPMLCSSIAPDGSDFTINGTYPVTITGAKGNCVNGKSKEVIVSFSKPLLTKGSFTITLQPGRDGNTVIDECAEETLPSTISFITGDTVNADFTYNIRYGCEMDTVNYFHPGGNDINSWNWTLAERQKSNLQNPLAYYEKFNEKQVKLIVSNGICSDSAVNKVFLENALFASFFVHEDNCPAEQIPFQDLSIGKGLQYAWEFGDGGTSNLQHPEHMYAVPTIARPYTIRLTITDSFGCMSAVERNIMVYNSCFIAVPTGFTPNNDGKNDLFGPLNAVKALNMQFTVYNRWGELVYKTTDWKKRWDGKKNNQPQPTGTYVWLLSYTDRDTNRKMQQKGMVTLIR